MKSPSICSGVLTALSFGSMVVGSLPTAHAQTPQLEELAPDTGWFIRLGGFVRSGVKMSLKDRQIATPALGNATDGYTYDNGFVKPDAGGSAKETYNWGYTGTGSESYKGTPQYVAGGSSLTFQHVDNAARVGDVDLGNQSLYGGQITGGFEVGQFKLWRREVKWGFEAGYSYSTTSASATAQAHSSGATLTTHVYSLVDESGVYVPPQAPFTGSFTGPNFLLPRDHTSTTSPVADATASLAATMNANIHTLRVGPWFEMPLARKLFLGFSFGYATTLADTELKLSESTTYSYNVIPGTDLGTAVFRHSEWVPGAYAQLRATYMFTQHVGAFVGAEVQWSKDLNFMVRSREADLRFGATLGGVLGLNLSF